MTRISKRKVFVGLLLAAGSLGWAAPASAQALRTWVSGEGDDLNTCARNNPCRTFAGALSKTATGGQISCLDPHSYGAVTITKSISIVCQYTGTPISASGLVPHGVTINVAAGDFVFLSGLDINGGAGSASPGTNGIRILGGGTIHIQDSMIRGFRANDGVGLRIAPNAAAQVTVSNSTIADNGSGANGGGILIQPAAGMTGTARVTLRNVLIQSNANSQVRVDTTGATAPMSGITLLVDDSQILGGTNGISINQPAATTGVTTMITDSYIALCSGTGLITAGTNTVRMRVADTTITACGTGVSQGGTTVINTWENNRTDGNGAPGTFTLPALIEK